MNTPTPKPQYVIKQLRDNEIDLPWFCPAFKDYRNKIALLQKKMAGEYSNFQRYLIKIFEKLGEEKAIKRLLPKSELSMVFEIDIVAGGKSSVYVMILGSEVATKPKSMQYADGKDRKDFLAPYFVICSKEILNEQKFGKAVGQRQLSGQPIQEWDCMHPGVQELLIRLIKVVMTKENISLT